jgi:hypothetical protein
MDLRLRCVGLLNLLDEPNWDVDMKRNIFIGIKETGAFQHSSFTGGGLISSAGLIKVKSGRIHKLSPLSGHYRTSVNVGQSFALVCVFLTRIYSITAYSSKI